MKKASWFILFLLLGVSCLDQPDCFRQNLNLVGVSFKKMLDGKQDTVYIFKILSPQTSGEVLFYDTIFATSVSLPVDYLNEAKQTSFLLYRGPSDVNPATLQVSYNTKTQFVSEDCGARFLVSGLEIGQGTAGFDSVRLISGVLSNPAQTNIAVYRCPITNLMKVAFGQYGMNLGVSQTDYKQIVSISTSYGTTFLYNPKVPVNSVRLPVDPDNTSCQFMFKFSDGSADTLNVTYRQTLHTFFGNRCGEQKTFRLDTGKIVTSFRKNLRFIRIRRDSLFDPPLTNVEVIQCPQNNLVNILFKTILTQGGATVRDSVVLTHLTADYPTRDLLAGISGKITNITVPLNPNSTATRFYFEMTRDSLGTLQKDTLQVSYGFGDPISNHSECGVLTPITQLQINNTTFGAQTKVDDPNVKFPVVSNIEIVQ